MDKHKAQPFAMKVIGNANAHVTFGLISIVV